jgi:hypothetical protein
MSENHGPCHPIQRHRLNSAKGHGRRLEPCCVSARRWRQGRGWRRHLVAAVAAAENNKRGRCCEIVKEEEREQLRGHWQHWQLEPKAMLGQDGLICVGVRRATARSHRRTGSRGVEQGESCLTGLRQSIHPLSRCFCPLRFLRLEQECCESWRENLAGRR